MKCENWEIIQSEKTNLKRFELKHFQSLKRFSWENLLLFFRKSVEIKMQNKTFLSIVTRDECKSPIYTAFEAVLLLSSKCQSSLELS